MNIHPARSYAGPKIRSRKIPSNEEYRALKSFEPETLLDFIKLQINAIERHDYGGVIDIVQYVVVSDFEPKIFMRAGWTIEKIDIRHVNFHHNYRQFGFKKKIMHYYELGVLYELLPREIALPLFAQNYLVADRFKVNTGNKLMLCFSKVKEAAQFAYALWKKYPFETESLLRRYYDTEDIPYFRYGRSGFLREFDSLRMPEIK